MAVEDCTGLSVCSLASVWFEFQNPCAAPRHSSLLCLLSFLPPSFLLLFPIPCPSILILETASTTGKKNPPHGRSYRWPIHMYLCAMQLGSPPMQSPKWKCSLLTHNDDEDSKERRTEVGEADYCALLPDSTFSSIPWNASRFRTQ